MEPQLSPRETSLVEAFRRLRPNAQLDWSDSWSDADLKEFTAASVGRLEVEESEEPR
jgi:hypothetical protein